MTVTEVIQEIRSTTAEKSVVVDGIGRAFGDVEALRGISFEVARGEVVALLGPNGAGKTTTVDILSTLTRPDRGKASIAGFDVVSDPASVRRSIMLTGQQVALDDVLTGRENLVLFGRLQGLAKSAARSRAEELLGEFDLLDAADRRVGTYSGGMRRRIDIACGLVVRPEVVFLDEPTTGLDPRSRQVIWDLVADFKNLGIATLLTTQYLEEADALSDRIIVIDHGVIVAEGTADELKERTGGSYCEIVPRDLKDLPAVVAALGSLLPEQNRAALTDTSDRIAMPAPNGPNTLVEALSRLNAANIELTDIALRRPSLDDVFLALTKDTDTVAVPGESADDDESGDGPGSTPNGRHQAAEPATGGARSLLSSHSKALMLLAVCAVAVTAVSLFVLQKDSDPAGDRSVKPAVVGVGPAPGSPPSAPERSLPAAAPPTVVPSVGPRPTAQPIAAPRATQLPVAAPATRSPVPVSSAVQNAVPHLQAPITSAAVAVSPPPVAITSPAVAVGPPAQIPTVAPAEAISAPQAPIAAPPAPAGLAPEFPVQPAAMPPQQVPPQEVPPAPAPDPLQVVLKPLLDALP